MLGSPRHARFAAAYFLLRTGLSQRFEPLADHRQSIRLPGYDYGQAGAYFITVCVAGRRRILGSVRGGIMRLSDAGRAVQGAWERLPSHYPHVRLDAFVIMPNHVHGIVMLASGDEPRTGRGRDVGMDRDVGEVGAGLRPAPTVARATIPTTRDVPPGHGVPIARATIPPTRDVPMYHRRHALPEIIRAFKSFSARAINLGRGTPGARLWQRNYYESIVRDERHLEAVRRYIRENPAVWGEDRFH